MVQSLDFTTGEKRNLKFLIYFLCSLKRNIGKEGIFAEFCFATSGYQVLRDHCIHPTDVRDLSKQVKVSNRVMSKAKSF